MKAIQTILLGAVLMCACPAGAQQPQRGPYGPAGTIAAPAIIADGPDGTRFIYMPPNTIEPQPPGTGDKGLHIYNQYDSGTDDGTFCFLSEYDTVCQPFQVGDESVTVQLSEPKGAGTPAWPAFVRFFDIPPFQQITRVSCWTDSAATASINFDVVVCNNAATCPGASVLIAQANAATGNNEPCTNTLRSLTLESATSSTGVPAGIGIRNITETSQTDELYITIWYRTF